MTDIVPIRPSIKTQIKYRNARQLNEVLGTLHMKMWSGIPDYMKTHNNGRLFIINHTTMGDVLGPHYTLNCLGVKPYYMAAEFLWEVPFAKKFFKRGKFIKVERGTANANKAYQQTLEILKSGGDVAMYPEGRIPKRDDSADYLPSPIKNGAARLQIETGCSVYPVGHAGAPKATSGSIGKKVAGAITAEIRGVERVVYVGEPVEPRPEGPIDLMSLRETNPKMYRDIVDTDTGRLQEALTESTQTAIDIRQQKTGKKR
ncbi:lysophospholipid acyltransferase family protein [Shimazuella alba]|uniref:Phospholipid/glycerol acyltransferase domain-containing protein n=1 Tax=Shimazuella alba TaxID=2690964 RepID=A0A6I4VYC7_9BACL|nr:lysophospholipid acyltransferase family protein [Shimazuella alba]MXQ55751.1 hypothetical protein [Shimazuella alba]